MNVFLHWKCITLFRKWKHTYPTGDMVGSCLHYSRTHSKWFPGWSQVQGREGGRQCEPQLLEQSRLLGPGGLLMGSFFNKAQKRMGMASFFEMPFFK